ncbi:MAG: Sua5 family C-terminal domain-containing protein, partial [Pseudomonadota bacterium]
GPPPAGPPSIRQPTISSDPCTAAIAPANASRRYCACTGNGPALLRAGALATEEIEAVSGTLRRPGSDPQAPSSPGQLLRHYAPKAALRLNAAAPAEDEAFLGFGPGDATLNLSESANLREAAANLFAMLRTLDSGHDGIAVAPIPSTGLGEAINDRLRRAAQR